MTVSRWRLEVFAAGDLPSEQATALEREIAADTAAQEQLDEIKQSNAEILKQYPPDETVAAIERRLHLAETREAVAAEQSTPARGWSTRLAWATPMLAGAALLVIAIMPTDDPETLPPEIIFLKGAPQLVAFRERADEQVRLTVIDADARAGDRIQLGYVAPEGGWGLILSIDGNGQLTRHWPGYGRAGRLEPAPMTLLDHSYELDDAPRFERFVLVYAGRVFDAGPIEDALRGAGDDPTAGLALPDGLGQVELVVSKP